MDFETYLRFAISLVFVLGLILAAGWAARRFGLAQVAKPGRKRRLALVEVLPLDTKRRLVLVSRDGQEHLLLLGSGTDQVVERNIAPVSAPKEEDKAC